MKLYQELESQLKKEPNFVTDNGELKKWVVLNKAQNFDEELIELLLDNEELKAKFFRTLSLSKGEDVTIFNQNLFARFLEQKNYLNDSYTKYKNKVGLTIDGKYLKQRNETALVWPFKDCILEGGQSREEDKREEIFFNEILAQDEITQLLEPKVLTNAKRFDISAGTTQASEHPLCHSELDSESLFTRDAELNKKRSLPEDTITDNLIIKGNNLLALHSLKKEFAGKVKLIYIDPPYNTGNDGFKYNDSFNHSTWLTFMKNRLSIAKELLRKDGVIMVHCDDNEQSYLKILMDDVFNTFNFQATLITNATPNGRDYGFFAQNQEYIHIFSKNNSSTKLNKVEIKDTSKYNKEDKFGRYYLHPLFNSNSNFHKGNRPNLYYPFYASIFPNDEGYYNLTLEKDKDTVEIFPPLSKKDGTQFVWRWGKEKAQNNLNIDIVGQKMNNGEYRVAQKMRLGKKLPRTIWNETSYSNRRGTEELQSLFNKKIFAYPKSEYLIKQIVTIGSSESDIVLDFHIGSGTTAAVAHKMNRQYIGIEQMDYIETVAVERLKKVIEGEQGGISKSVNWQGGGSFTYFELKKYNQTFIEQIASASSATALLKIWQQMKAKSFLNYNVNIKKQEEHIEDFKQLSLEEQKQHLCELLDKNQLYVNLSSLNDTEFECTDEEKKVTQDFYQIKKQ